MARCSSTSSTCGSVLCLTATSTTWFYTLSLHDALPICFGADFKLQCWALLVEYVNRSPEFAGKTADNEFRSEEHTSELQSHSDLVCRLLLEKKNATGAAARSPSPTAMSCSARSGPSISR